MAAFYAFYVGLKAIGDITTTVVTQGGDTYLQESGSNPNISAYVRVKQVNLKTPNYIDNSGKHGTGSNGQPYPTFLPVVGSGSLAGSFGDAIGSNIKSGEANNYYQNINNSNTQGLTGSDYTNAIALLLALLAVAILLVRILIPSK